MRLALAVALLLGWLGLADMAHAQTTKRLILTDGSYQTVREWKIEGDRVEYLSAERGDWEELPRDLVDWAKTEEWNAEASQTQEKELKQESGQEVAERKEEELNTPQVAPEVAPELRLPAEGGVFAFEVAGGKPWLQPLREVAEELQEGERARPSLVPGLPLPNRRPVRERIELKGARAKVRIKAAAVTLFVDEEDEQGVIPGGEFRLLRLESKGGKRLLGTATVAADGSDTVKANVLPSGAEKFHGDWWKLVPQMELKPGEYAIEIDPARQSEGAALWDFGVDP